MGTNTYHVTFYYLATGMDGIPMERDHGSVTASSEKEAIDTVIKRQYAHHSDNDRGFVRGCLSAKLVGDTA